MKKIDPSDFSLDPSIMMHVNMYLSYCLYVSIYLMFLINGVQVGLFRRPAIILNARTFSSTVDSVGLASTHITYLLFVLSIILPVSFGLSLQSVLFSISVKWLKPVFKTPKILELLILRVLWFIDIECFQFYFDFNRFSGCYFII